MANNNTEVTFEIMEHIGVLDTYDNREQAWTKEVNIVSWNGGPAKMIILANLGQGSCNSRTEFS